MNGRKQKIKKPYGAREMLLDIIIGIQAGIIYIQIAEDIDLITGIITTLTWVFMTAAMHYDITTKWNRRMYHRNKRKREERRIYIQAQQEKTKGA